jgi:hypothetical protein
VLAEFVSDIAHHPPAAGFVSTRFHGPQRRSRRIDREYFFPRRQKSEPLEILPGNFRTAKDNRR